MLLLLPLYALCFAASTFNFGTSVKLEGISTEKKGLSVTYRTFNKTEKDDAFVVLQLTGANINDSEVGRKGSDCTNNVSPNSTSAPVLYMLLTFVLYLLFFVQFLLYVPLLVNELLFFVQYLLLFVQYRLFSVHDLLLSVQDLLFFVQYLRLFVQYLLLSVQYLQYLLLCVQELLISVQDLLLQRLEFVVGEKRSDSTNNVTPNSTSVLMLYLLLAFVLNLVLFVLSAALRPVPAPLHKGTSIGG
uniref:Uncharacterized protein n=1 Tax=Globodera pallida TaxID=36090 RepID=A0A183BJL4_GLOPA